jgi:hypothetical protein
MKAKTIFSFIRSLLLFAFIGIAIATVGQEVGVQVNPVAAGLVSFVTVNTYFLLVPSGYFNGLLLAGVNKEIWTDKLKEKFYNGYEWLNGVDDWSEFVEYNTINFTVMGADPVVLKNNAVWPIVAAQRTDTNSTAVLATYDTTTTRVRNVEEIESSINKLESVVSQHRDALMQEIVTECLWNYSPATAVAGAFAATGANRAAVIGAQTTVATTLAIKDIARAQQELDNRRFPKKGRVIVLNPYHREDLLAQDVSLQKAFASLKTGEVLDLYGFKIYCEANTPLYTKSTLAKKAYAAAADNTNDCVASTIFIQGEVMKCMGDMEMFYKEKGINPEQRADEVGFQMRFLGNTTRADNFLQIAIVSNRA